MVVLIFMLALSIVAIFSSRNATFGAKDRRERAGIPLPVRQRRPH